MAEPFDEQRGEELTAYLDGELDERSAEALERRLQRDAGLRREADSLKRTWELLDFLPQPEPSPSFTARTLDKLAVVVPPRRASAPVAPATTSARGPWPRRLALAAAALVVGLLGYALPGLFLGPKSLTLEQRELEMARDLRVLDRLMLYQYGEDLEFLKGLDNSDLFGD